MSQHTLQNETNLIMKAINNPNSQTTLNQMQILIENIDKLCQLRGNPLVCFEFDGSTYCSLCQENVENSSYKELPCGHNAHFSCFQQTMLNQSETLQMIELQYCCKEKNDCQDQQITDQLLYCFFGFDYVQNIRNVAQITVELPVQKEITICQICKGDLGDELIHQLPCLHWTHIQCFRQEMLKGSAVLKVDDLTYCCQQGDICKYQLISDQLLFEVLGREFVIDLRAKKNEEILKTLEIINSCQLCQNPSQGELILLSLPCKHFTHITCFKENMLSQSKALILKELKYCCSAKESCTKIIMTEDLLNEFFGKLEISKIREEESVRLCQQLEKQDKDAIRQNEEKTEFECAICTDKLKVNSDAITLDCDHRFCKSCIVGHIQQLVSDGKFSEEEIKCSFCPQPIEFQILEQWVPEEAKKISDFRAKNLAPTKSEKQVQCPAPGCPQSFFVDIEEKFPTCPSGHKFCANKCDKAHEGISCQEYRLKNRVNLAQGYVQCPKCLIQIFKDGGCNHITCKCKYEFCFVCGKNYKPKRECKCPQNGTVDRFLGMLKFW